MNELETLFKMIEEFLNGNYDVDAFSYESEIYLFNNYEEIERINYKVAKYLNDELPVICDAYKPGDEFVEFKNKISSLYEKAKQILKDSSIKTSYKKPEKPWKLRYVGESFGSLSLTNGKIYEAWYDLESGLCRVIDDSGEDYLYSWYHPAPLDGRSPGGRWEIIEVGE